MKNFVPRVLGGLLVSVLFFSGVGQAEPFASHDEPHAVVDLDIARPASSLYEAFFLSVDGTNVHRERQQILLKPGVHKIRFGAVFTEHAMLMRDTGRKRDPTQNELSIEVKAGMRYTVAAKLEGHRGDKWKPVVTKEAALRF